MSKILNYLLGRPTASSEWAPSLTIGYPNPGQSGRRPWGLINTRRTWARGTRRMSLPRRTDTHTALLLSQTVTDDVLTSQDWRLALRHIHGDHQSLPTYVALAVTVIGVLTTTWINPSSVLALVALLVPFFAILIVATIATYRWDSRRTAAAHARIFGDQTGHRFAVVPLVTDDHLAAFTTLIHDADTLALEWQLGHVDDDVWHTALDMLFPVAEDAQNGSPVTGRLHSYHVANDYITSALDHIGTTGHVASHDLAAA